MHFHCGITYKSVAVTVHAQYQLANHHIKLIRISRIAVITHDRQHNAGNGSAGTGAILTVYSTAKAAGPSRRCSRQAQRRYAQSSRLSLRAAAAHIVGIHDNAVVSGTTITTAMTHSAIIITTACPVKGLILVVNQKVQTILSWCIAWHNRLAYLTLRDWGSVLALEWPWTIQMHTVVVFW